MVVYPGPTVSVVEGCVHCRHPLADAVIGPARGLAV